MDRTENIVAEMTSLPNPGKVASMIQHTPTHRKPQLLDDLNNPDEPEWPESLRIAENFSTLARFNDEKSWIEFMLTRVYPIAQVKKSTLIFGIMKGVHSEWAYKQLEGSADGIMEFRLEGFERAKDLLQITTMRNVHFNRELHELKVGENFEVTVEK